MHIGLIYRSSKLGWGGDLEVKELFQSGFEECGHKVSAIPIGSPTPSNLDYAFLFNIFIPQGNYPKILKEQNTPFGIAAMHLDFPQFKKAESGFHQYIELMLYKKKLHGQESTLERLLATPDWIYLYQSVKSYCPFEVLQALPLASLIVANAPKEKMLIEKSYPINGKLTSTFWSIPHRLFETHKEGSFLERFGFKNKEFFLHIGTSTPRKNQLGSILALRNHKAPLVLISMQATKAGFDYMRLCALAANQYRKAPTFLITNNPYIESHGHFKVIKTDGLLTEDEIRDAYASCYMYLQPSFYESPGFTYLEAAWYGAPVVATAWSTLSDYCNSDPEYNGSLNKQIAYCIPYDIISIEKAIEKLEGLERKHPPRNHSIFKRSTKNLASDLLQFMNI